MLNYQKRFNPEQLCQKAPSCDKVRRPFIADYEYDDSIILAVNVALATGRPLLLRGDPGSGKSTLAEDVARLLGWRYYEQVISSNLEAADLFFRVDHVSRIADAQAGHKDACERPELYLEPGILFWAFAPNKAKDFRGKNPERQCWELDNGVARPAVILLDEIDKAEPDFPNDLLVPLGSLSFQVRTSNLDFVVQADTAMRPLVMITTNEERDLSPAFLRRCVVLRLQAPDEKRLVNITRRHFSENQLSKKALEILIKRYFELRNSAKSHKLRPPSTAEFLDTARALIELEMAPDESILQDSWAYKELTHDTLWKHPLLPEERA
jgi:MoxR-like ATPase